MRHCAYHADFAKEKIIYAEIVYDSAFFYDRSGFYGDVSTFILTGEGIKSLTALLNSELLTFAFRTFYAGGSLRGETFRYKKAFLQNLPVIVPNENYCIVFEALVDYIQELKKRKRELEAQFFEQVVDALVYELYFPEEVIAAGKDVLARMGGLEPVVDTMSEEERLAVIQREFTRLYHPSHPVRNRVETLDCVEGVRVIRKELHG